MAATVSELQVVVSANTKPAEAGLSTFSSKLGSVGATMAAAFGAAAVGGVVAVGAAMAGATGSAAGFEKQLSSIKAVSGSTASEMEQIRALALDLGAATAYSATEAAQGIEELIKAGVSVGDVMGGGAAAAMNLAAAGAVSVKDAAELTSNALNAFGLAGADAARVADLIAGAANASAIDVGDFKFSLAAVGAVANTVGFSIEDTAAAIALLGNAGIKGSDAGTSLKTMFLNLQPTTKAQIGLFRELGLLTADGANKFFDASGKVKGMSEVAGTLQDALKGMTDQQKLATLETIFGSDAIRAAAVFAKQGAAGIDEMAASMSKVTAEAVAQERLNNVAGAWEQLTGAAETAAITFGSHLLPALKEALQWGDSAVSDLIPTMDSVGKAVGGALSDGVTRAKDLFRQLGDAARTAQQAFAGEWEASDQIEPIALAAGNAALALKDLSEWGGRVADAASRMGAWDGFANTLSTVSREADRVGASVGKIGEALGRFDAISGKAGSSGDGVARVLSAIGTAAHVSVLGVATVIDTFATMIAVGLDTVNGLFAVGRGFYALAKGDIPTFLAAGDLAEASFVSAGQTMMAWANNNATRVQEAYTAIAGSAQTNMPAMAAAVETNAAAATAALEGAAPQMAAAAEAGAAGAVAAVQGQSGAAHAAGASVGQSLGDGMQGGILSRIGAVISAARQMVAAALSGAEAEGEIRSPSKRTMYMGQMLDEGLVKGIEGSAPAVKGAMRQLISDITDYGPVSAQIAQVEKRIKEIRDEANTAALFRAESMITIDSEALRLKKEMVDAERALLPLRQDIARATRDISEAERGTLDTRRQLINFGKLTAEQNIEINKHEKEKIPLRARELEIERMLLGLDPSSKRAKSLKEEQEEIRKKSGLIDNTIAQIRLQTRSEELDIATIKERQTIASTAARIRKEELEDQALEQERNIGLIKEQIDVLGAEQASFQANENIIKNATENEIAYRQRLIAVFTAEGKPLADRITAGLALVDQLEAEGKVSKELADKLRDVAKEANASTGKTAALGNAAATAAPQIDAAAQKAAEMAKQAESIAKGADNAAGEISGLAKSLGKLPDWFTPKGGKAVSVLFPPGRADGGAVSAGMSYLVGERGPELFTPAASGHITPNHQLAAISPPAMGSPSAPSGGGDTYVIDLRGAQSYDGARFEDLMVRALERAGRGGRITQVTL